MKTLKEKREELLEKYKEKWEIPMLQKVWWEKIFKDIEKQDKECFKEILDEIENVRTFDRTPYEAIKDIKQIIKNKSGFEK